MTGIQRRESRALDTIAQELRHEVEQAEQHWQTAVHHAIRAGELLAEAKSKVKHGEWLPWLEANFQGSERTAQNYVRLAQNPKRVADLPTIRGAVAALAEPKESEPKPEDIETEARRLVAEKNDGRDVNPHLVEAEVQIQTALLWRHRSVDALWHVAEIHIKKNPVFAAASLNLAAVYLDVESGPWDEREQEAQERWRIALAELRVPEEVR